MEYFSLGSCGGPERTDILLVLLLRTCSVTGMHAWQGAEPVAGLLPVSYWLTGAPSAFPAMLLFASLNLGFWHLVRACLTAS